MATILVAEDHAETRERLRCELRERGHQVITAANGLEALHALDAYEFDVVLSDLRIPGSDGMQVRAWKQLAPETEVVVGSHHDELAGAIESIKGGAFDYVEKPYEMPPLLATLERALERRQLRAASALYETSRVILATSEPERLPEVIVGVAAKAMNADDVALLVPGDDGRLHVACSVALTESVRRAVQSSLDDLMSPAMREPMITQHGRVQSCILYPLYAGERLVGLLAISRVINPRAFTKLDLEKAAVLASQILLALENMRLVRHAISTERLATIGQVATSIAHEVNNPIAYVLASHEHLVDKVDEAIAACASDDPVRLRAALEAMRAPLADIRDGAERVRDIVRDTRSLADTNDTPVMFDVGESIRSALRITAADLRHRTTVTTKLADDTCVLGRSGRLSQVFVNLLVHTTASFDDHPHNSIQIVSKIVGGHVVVTLRDNGPTIPADRLPRLFDPFFMTNLAIARDVVRSHGGEIAVESSAVSGTIYTVVLPYAAGTRLRRVSDGPPPGAEGARLRILLIDDEPNILRSYRRALGATHELVFAQHGEEALAAIREHGDFDLVVCDVSMPTMSGMQLFERVRARVPQLASRFVFATGGATQRNIEQFLASIPNLVLEKPFELSVLRKLVADLQRAS